MSDDQFPSISPAVRVLAGIAFIAVAVWVGYGGVDPKDPYGALSLAVVGCLGGYLIYSGITGFRRKK